MSSYCSHKERKRKREIRQSESARRGLKGVGEQEMERESSGRKEEGVYAFVRVLQARRSTPRRVGAKEG